MKNPFAPEWGEGDRSREPANQLSTSCPSRSTWIVIVAPGWSPVNRS